MRRYASLLILATVFFVVSLLVFAGTRAMRGQPVEPVVAAQPSPTRAPTPTASPGSTPRGTPIATPTRTPIPTPRRWAGEPLPDNPDTRQPWWFVPYLDRDATRPRFNQTIAGITVGPDVRPAAPICVSGSAQWATFSQAAGTPVAITPTYLPSGSVAESPEAVVCRTTIGQTVMLNARQPYTIPADPTRRQRGGSFTIFRQRGEPESAFNIPAERWSAGTIAGKPAAIARPIIPNGLGESAVVIYDGGVLTRIQAFDLPLTEVLRVAEGLFQ